jgi:hypothetical protein
MYKVHSDHMSLTERTDEREVCDVFLSPLRTYLPHQTAPPAVRTATRRSLGRNVASMLLQNHLIPNLSDERSRDWSDDDTVSITESNLDDCVDVFRIDDDSHTAMTDNLSCDSATLLPKTVGDPTLSVNIQQFSIASMDSSVDDPPFVFKELSTRSCRSDIQTEVATAQDCRSVDDKATLPT